MRVTAAATIAKYELCLGPCMKCERAHNWLTGTGATNFSSKGGMRYDIFIKRILNMSLFDDSDIM